MSCPRHVFLEIPLEIRYSVCKWLPEISAEIKYSHALPSAGNLPFRARTLRSTNHCNTQRAAPTIAQYNFFDHQRAWSRVPASRRVLLSSLVGMSTNDAMRAELSQAGGNRGVHERGRVPPAAMACRKGCRVLCSEISRNISRNKPLLCWKAFLEIRYYPARNTCLGQRTHSRPAVSQT